VFVEGSVVLDEILLILGHIFQSVNRIGSAGRNASAAVDAALGIDVPLGCGFESRLVLLGMDAIGGADLDAEGVLDAGISNYIGHDESVSRMK
jgi:hypothetical protein